MFPRLIMKTGEKRFWFRVFIVYACIEILFAFYSYITYKNNCAGCPRPLISFINEGILEMLYTFSLWFVLLHFHRIKYRSLLKLNLLVFTGYFILLFVIKYVVIRSGLFQLSGVDYENDALREVINDSWFDIGKYVLKLSAFYVVQFYTDYQKSSRQRTELAVINKDLQLNLLKQQLSPHFYFNTLNNLYGLARNNSAKLSPALSQLSDIMQYVINDCNCAKVLLTHEIRFLQSYIALEKLRYEEDTIIDMKVKGLANGEEILPLVLIQFVENAFKHGMKEKSEKNWMKVCMDISHSQLVFSVDNSFYGADSAEGIGLSSAYHRLNLQYEGKYNMITKQENDRFSVRLELNLS